MPLGTTTADDILEQMLNDTAVPWDADTDVYLALHTANPGVGGNQTTSEATYTSYARVAVTRAGTAWTITGGVAANDNLIQFPLCTGGTNTLTYVSLGRAASGSSQILAVGALSASLAVANGIQPQFAVSALGLTLA